MLKEITNGLDPEQKKDIRDNYKGSSLIRERLVEIFQKELDKVVGNEEKLVNYESDNWSLQVADSRGYRRGIRFAMKYLKK
jgi:hypothetical protein